MLWTLDNLQDWTEFPGLYYEFTVYVEIQIIHCKNIEGQSGYAILMANGKI